MNNAMYSYADDIDQVAEAIQQSSGLASPKAAQKLTAQSLGIILHVMNQQMRGQATGIKLQAQAMAIQNHKDKLYARQVRGSAENLKMAMNVSKPAFKIPRVHP